MRCLFLRRTVFAAALAGCFVAAGLPAAGDEFEILLRERLQEDVSYQQSVLSLEQAKLRRAQVAYSAVPYLSVSSSGSIAGFAGIGNSSAPSDPFVPSFSVTPSLRFSNALGTEISVATTFSYPEVAAGAAGPAGLGFGTPTLSVSRAVFADTVQQQLSAEAAFIRARLGLQTAEHAVRDALIGEILDAYLAERSLEGNRQNLEVLTSLYSSAVDEDSRRALERQILTARRSILQAEHQAAKADRVVSANMETLYAEVRTWLSDAVSDLPEPGTVPQDVQSIRALTLELAAAQRESDRWFLPFVPNPTVTASVGFDTATQSVEWGVSVKVGATVLDRGEREVEAAGRRAAERIAELQLRQSKEALRETVSGLWGTLLVQQIDLRLAELDLEDAQAQLRTTEKLHDQGFATAEELISAEIDVSLRELSLLSAEHARLTTELRLLEYF
jgi:outer membrane protein TolC